MSNLNMEISTFRNVKNSAAKPAVWNEKQFLAAFSKHKVRLTKDGKLFAPATFKKSRSNNNFISSSGICEDFDHGRATPESVLALFPGNLAAYYSTHSHTLESPRFRVVLPLSRAVNAEEHGKLIKGIKSIIPPELMECIDKSCFERARSHYLPSCPPDNQDIAFVGHQEGELLDVEYYIRLGEAVAPVEVERPKMAKKGAEAAPPGSGTVYLFTIAKTGEVIDLTAWAAQKKDFDILAAINPKFALGPVVDGKQPIVCPFSSEHTDSSPDFSTFIANADTDHPSWTIHCMHSHCVDRDRLAFFQKMLEQGWIDPACLMPATLPYKRVQKIYYPAGEMAASLQLRTLAPDEFRVLLHLMHLAWAAEDGTLPDDNWMISRSLGLEESLWMKYRMTLNRAGWLDEVEGRLTNDIFRREFANAQNALDSFRARGSKGGKNSRQHS